MPKSADVVIAGGGFAGAATAYHLAQRGVRGIVLLEAEDQFGAHASGLNAAMARQVVEDGLTGALLHSSVTELIRMSAADFRPCGSLLLVQGEGQLIATARGLAGQGLDCRFVDHDVAVSLVPVLEGAEFAQGIFTPSDGVVDIHGLLWSYLRGARALGARLMTSCPVTHIEIANGCVVAIGTPLGSIKCKVFVNAAGAWANMLAEMAHLSPLPMTPFRRHLAVTPPIPGVDQSWPFVWHVEAGFYFRPEVGGLLLSPCDQTPVEAGPAVRDPAAIEDLARKLATSAPALAALPIKRYWAGLRTIAADQRFIIGFDPRLEGFFWVAGLGGHGMTGSFMIGSIAAALITGATAGPFAQAFAPRRFL